MGGNRDIRLSIVTDVDRRVFHRSLGRCGGTEVHGMEEVRGSNPLSSTAGQRPVRTRETGLFHDLSD
jgi:hypothetical protein